MDTRLYFLPAAICILATLVALLCAVGITLFLRRRRNGHHGPEDTELAPTRLASPTRRSVWGNCLLWLAGMLMVGGLVGVWATGLSVGWIGGTPPEWSDGRAPELEPIIRSRCVPFIQQGKAVGMTVAVVTRRGTTVMAFGRPSLASFAPANGDTVFEIGSITKTFTAIALARALEHGAMGIDQPLQELLPGNVELPADARTVTLRHLTTHTSGFPRIPGDHRSYVPGFVKMLLFGSDPDAGFTEAALLAHLRGVKLQSKPGKKSEYSNFGMTTLGYLLAKNASLTYEALIERDVCAPLGMDDTKVDLRGTQADRFAQGYRAVLRYGPVVIALRSAPWENAHTLGGAGALRSTGADMLKYLRANMHPAGSPIEHALRESHRELFRENDRKAIGMNWVRSRKKDPSDTLIWHNGGTGGFTSFLGFTEEEGVGVLILSNTAQDVDSLAMDLLRDLSTAE